MKINIKHYIYATAMLVINSLHVAQSIEPQPQPALLTQAPINISLKTTAEPTKEIPKPPYPHININNQTDQELEILLVKTNVGVKRRILPKNKNITLKCTHYQPTWQIRSLETPSTAKLFAEGAVMKRIPRSIRVIDKTPKLERNMYPLLKENASYLLKKEATEKRITYTFTEQ